MPVLRGLLHGVLHWSVRGFVDGVISVSTSLIVLVRRTVTRASTVMQVYVAELDPVLNLRTLTDYDVKRFFWQFGASPLGVWSNPIGNWVEDKDDMELRNTYMYGLDVMFHRCALRACQNNATFARLWSCTSRGSFAMHT